MKSFCTPWGFSQSVASFRPSIRTHFVSQQQLCDNDSQQSGSDFVRIRQRSPSLPPIYTQKQEKDKDHHYEEAEGETSGYGSESGGNDYIRHPRVPWTQNRGYITPESSVSTPPYRWSEEANRLRWGDRGVGVGHLWEPSFEEPNCRLPQVSGSDTPGWLERGLRKLGHSDIDSDSSTQVLVINHDSHNTHSRELNGSLISLSSQPRTFIRGQNVPLEPEELLERENKRKKALEHQSAIKQQLEERDRKRREDKERRLREESEEEERIRREQEKEKQRYEAEKRQLKEKQEKEQRKAQAMKEALEQAEKLALQEKQKSKQHVREDSCVACRETTPVLGTITDTCSVTSSTTSTPTSKKPPQNNVTMGEPLAIEGGLAVVLDTNSYELLPHANAGHGLQLALLMSPRQYSSRSQPHDAATQTDTSRHRKDRKKSASLERPHRGCKLPLRCRSQSQPRVSLEDRPKWGVNRPGTQYIKQSDKDPHYQRRLRQRLLRAVVASRGHRGSSDENSRTPSPKGNRSNNESNPTLRHFFTRYPWRKADTGKRNPSLVSLDLASLTSADQEKTSREKITLHKTVKVLQPQHVIPGLRKKPNHNQEHISEKYKAKYIQPKGHNLTRWQSQKKSNLQSIDVESKENRDEWNRQNILSQLTSLRQSLIRKQKDWDIVRSPTPCSEKSNL